MPDAGCLTIAPRRLPELDGLRGLAALMVALSHYVLAFQPALLGGGSAVSHFPFSIAVSHTAAIALFNPELGVAIFFVLSGYVLAAGVTHDPAPLPELVLRRWVRLALPVLGTSLLIWPLAQWHLFRSVEAAGLAKSDWLRGNYAWLAFESNDLARLVWQSLFDLFARARHFYNPALWTMPTEFWGSVALFAGVAARRGLGRNSAWFGVSASLLVLACVWRTPYFGFPCGVALFELRRLLPLVRLPLGGAVLLMLGLLAGGTPYFIDLPFNGLYARLFLAMAPFIDNPVLLLHRVGAVCLVVACLFPGPLRRLLTGRACQFLGRISFMLYLVHVPLLCSAVVAGVLQLQPLLGYNAATAALLPVFLAVAVGLAVFCTRAIDEPSVRLSRRIRHLRGGFLRPLHRLPFGLHLAQGRVGGLLPARRKPRLHRSEAPGKLGIRMTQAVLRVEVKLARQVGEHEQQVAHLVLQPRPVRPAQFGAQLARFLLELVQHGIRVRPVERHPGGARGEFLRAGEGGQRHRDAA